MNLLEPIWILFNLLFQFLDLLLLPEEILAGGSALFLEHFPPSEILTSCPLVLERVSVLGVTVLQMLEGVVKCLDLFLAFEDLGVELVTLALKLLTFLGGFDYIVRLRMLVDSFYLPIRGLILLDQWLILNLIVIHTIPPLWLLYSNLMPFLLRGFILGQENILMEVNLSLTLLHAHLNLVLLVLKVEHVISLVH